MLRRTLPGKQSVHRHVAFVTVARAPVAPGKRYSIPTLVWRMSCARLSYLINSIDTVALHLGPHPRTVLATWVGSLLMVSSVRSTPDNNVGVIRCINVLLSLGVFAARFFPTARVTLHFIFRFAQDRQRRVGARQQTRQDFYKSPDFHISTNFQVPSYYRIQLSVYKTEYVDY